MQSNPPPSSKCDCLMIFKKSFLYISCLFKPKHTKITDFFFICHYHPCNESEQFLLTHMKIY